MASGFADYTTFGVNPGANISITGPDASPTIAVFSVPAFAGVIVNPLAGNLGVWVGVDESQPSRPFDVVNSLQNHVFAVHENGLIVATGCQLLSPLGVAYGGTGTATPALVAGANIGISGSWPNHTVAVSATPSFTSLALTNPLPVTSGGTGVASCSAGQILIASGTNTAAFTTPDGARVYHSVDQSIADTSNVQLAFDSELYDNGGLHDTVTNNSRLTAAKAGKYLITGHVAWAANSAGYRFMAFLLNAGALIAANRTAPLAAIETIMGLATIYHLAVGDYVELRVLQTSGGALNVLSSAHLSPEFALQWLGP